MTTRCPHCNSIIEVTLSRQTGDELDAMLTIMKTHQVGVYLGTDGNYWLERGYGRVSERVIREALAAQLLVKKWDKQPDNIKYWSVA